MMKRGCTVTFVHFHSYPILSRASQEKVRELVTLLTRWQQRSRVYLVPFGEIQQQVVLAVPGPMRVVVYRRLMMRIAEAIARARGAQALVTGDVVGQVASQTLENLVVVGAVATMPIFRPLIGMDKDEITAEAIRLGHLSDLDRARPGLLHAVHPAQPVDPGAARRGRGGGAGAADRRSCRSRRARSCHRALRIPGGRIEGQSRGVDVATAVSGLNGIASLLGDDTKLLEHQCKTIPKESLLLPGPDYVDRAYGLSDRSPRVLAALQSVLDTGRLKNTGYVSILPVDQGIEHSAGASFAPNPAYFDPENIVKLAIEGGLQCGRLNPRRARLGVAQVRAQDSVRGEAQSQRVHLVSEHVRSDSASAA
jgi:hypothetical protein